MVVEPSSRSRSVDAVESNQVLVCKQRVEKKPDDTAHGVFSGKIKSIIDAEQELH